MNKSSLFLLIVCTLLASSAAAQNKCTVHTTNARYGTTCQGFVSTAPGTPLAPFSLLGTCTGDANGFFKCTGTQSFDGTVVPAVDEGQSIVNSDCTGQVTYNKGTPGELTSTSSSCTTAKNFAACCRMRGRRFQCDLIRMDAPEDHHDE